MKKNIILYIVAFAALMVSSCTPDLLPGNGVVFGFRDGETGLVLNVRSTNPETRAIAPPDSYNEDRLEQFYYFIYKNNPKSNTSEAPVFFGKWTAPENTVVTGTGTEQNIVLDDLTTLKSADGNTYSGYVFIIANYKVEETLTAWDNIIASSNPDYSSLTWTNLQALPLPKPTFQVYRNLVVEDGYSQGPDPSSAETKAWQAASSNCMDQKQDEGHRFKAQDSFVMVSDPVDFSVTKGTPK